MLLNRRIKATWCLYKKSYKFLQFLSLPQAPNKWRNIPFCVENMKQLRFFLFMITCDLSHNKCIFWQTKDRKDKVFGDFCKYFLFIWVQITVRGTGKISLKEGSWVDFHFIQAWSQSKQQIDNWTWGKTF